MSHFIVMITFKELTKISWQDLVLCLRAGTTKMGQGAGGELGEVVDGAARRVALIRRCGVSF